METNLEGLIEKIKKEGVEEAKKRSQEIIDEAKLKAQKIIDHANNETNKLIEEASKEAESFKRNSQLAVSYAGRDVILKVREELIGLFDNVFKRSISQVFTPEFLSQLINKVIDKWEPKKDISFEVALSDKDKQKLEEFIFTQFKQEAKNAIEIKVSDNIDKGFRIKAKGENVFYDFSDESILEAFKEFLNPALLAILLRNE